MSARFRRSRHPVAISRCVFVVAGLAFLAAVVVAVPALAAAPTLTVDAVTTHTITTAEATGTITTDSEANGGAEAFWFFEYTESGKEEWVFGPQAFSRTVPVGTTARPVEEELSGLKASTSYEVRMAAYPFSGGETFSAPSAPFTTSPASNEPALALEPAGEISYTTAHVAGTVDPEGGNLDGPGHPVPISWALETNREGEGWNPVGTGTIEGAPAEESKPIAVEASLAGLHPGSAYAFRLRATYAGEAAVSGEGTLTTKSLPAPTVSIEPHGLVTATSVELSGHIDPNAPAGNPAAANVNWRFECEPQGCPGVEGQIAAGAANEPVGGTADGLLPGVHYEVKLVAENAAGPVQSTSDSFTTPVIAPAVTTGSPVHVGLTEATLEGELNPGGAETHYFFEYGTTTAYGNSTPVQSISEELDSTHPVEAQLTGLDPHLGYHYRLVASNPVEEVRGEDQPFHTFAASAGGGCANEAFRTGASAALPDCRAYELVDDPATMGSGQIYVPESRSPEEEYWNGIPTTRPFQVSTLGNRIAYIGDNSLTGGSGETGAALGEEYVAVRGQQGGWSNSVLQPPGRPSVIYQGFSPSLSVGILQAGSGAELASEGPLSPDAPGENRPVLYAHPTSGAAYGPLYRSPISFHRLVRSSISDLELGSSRFLQAGKAGAERVAFAGASSDFHDLVFEANDSLLAAGQPHAAELASAAQAEVAAVENLDFLYDSVEGHLALVDVTPGGTVEPGATFGGLPLGSAEANAPDFDHAISADGERIYWTANASGRIYLRKDPAAAEECGLPGEPGKACTIPVSAGAAHYWAASVDGRYALYTEAGRLLRFDAETETSTELAAGTEVEGIIGASESGETIYFVARGDLTGPEKNGHGEGAVSGEDNLYVLRGGQAPHFIARLSPQDGNSVEGFQSGQRNFTEYGDWMTGTQTRTAAVSADGESLVFMSDRSLTGAPNRGTDQVYIYNGKDGELDCASCSPTGEPPSGVSLLPLSWSQLSQYQWMSEDGNRVFFDSYNRLSPADHNSAQDVYEWEREGSGGSGGCTSAEAVEGGCVHLLSGGSSEYDSWFVGAGADGSDAFIVTRAHLSAADTDERMDLYDARVGAEPTTPTAVCEGREECKRNEAAPPGYASPPSSSFHGPGNPAPARCAKGKVRKMGKCVKKHQQKKHKKKHHKKSAHDKKQKRTGSKNGGHR